MQDARPVYIIIGHQFFKTCPFLLFLELRLLYYPCSTEMVRYLLILAAEIQLQTAASQQQRRLARTAPAGVQRGKWKRST